MPRSPDAKNQAPAPPPAAAKRVRISAALRRQQVLDEAIRLIGKRGYFGFSIQELAQLCNLTNAGLLHYFGSKDKLLIALLEDRDRRDIAAIVSGVGQEGQFVVNRDASLQDVLNGFHALVRRNSKQPELVRLYTVLQAEALNQNHPAHEYFRNRETVTLEAYAGSVARHVPKPRETARQLLALICGLEQQWLRADQSFNLVTAWDRAVALLLPQAEEPQPGKRAEKRP